jgi:hypothetical protein
MLGRHGDMSANARHVAIAVGHVVRVSRVPRATAAPGKIIVRNGRGRRWEIDEARWEAGTPA